MGKVGMHARTMTVQNENREGEGPNPSPLTNFHWPRFSWAHGGLPECPYFTRLVADCGAFSVRLHYWRNDDDDRANHDHPCWFWTLVLWGGYDDLQPGGSIDRLHIGSIRFRPATHQHRVRLRWRPTITLLITGPHDRKWGFWVNGKLMKRDKYFAEQGHHPCDTGSPVRMRPDGTRIG